MANTSRIKGFVPTKHPVSGYFGSLTWYTVPSSDATALYIGDPVKVAGSASTDGTKPTVTRAAAGDAIVGIVVGFGINRSNLNVDGQYRVASTDRDVLVCDDPLAVFEVEASNGTPAAADVNLNANHAVGTPDTTTARSGAYLDMGTKATTAALTFKILGFASRVDNEVGASAKLLVKINNHQYAAGTGTLGV